MRKASTVLLSLAMILLAAQSALAQTNAYPSRPVRLITSAAPGGNPDILARILAEKLTAAFGKPFVAENQPGAGGGLAAAMVARVKNDPYVLYLADSAGMAIIPLTSSSLNYDPLRDFTPITAVASVPTVLVVHPSLKVSSLAEFIELAKSEPNQLHYSSGGYLSIHHLTMVVFLRQTGLSLLHVPYRQGSPAATAIAAGEVQAGWMGIPNVLPFIGNSQIVPLALSTKKRVKALPNVPTMVELGYPEFDIGASIGLAGPAGISEDIVARLQSAVAKALREPDVAARMDQLGMTLLEDGTANYIKLIHDEMETYGAAVKSVGGLTRN